MRVLIACEYSGTVRDAFTARGHDATSCDLLPTETPGKHYQDDVMDIINDKWDLLIAHPPCTHLCSSGARHFEKKRKNGQQQEAIEFFLKMANANIPRIAIENPIGIMSTTWMPPTQIIQPWMFGHTETKATCLWLKSLPPLKNTKTVYTEMMQLPKAQRERIHWTAPGPNRWKERSKTYQGIAEAMADQWTNIKQMELI